jgi:hypothetical protein
MKWLLSFCLCGLGVAAHGQAHEEHALAAAVKGEAWSEGVRGMTAVAEVIHQRAVEKGWTPLQAVAEKGTRWNAERLTS